MCEQERSDAIDLLRYMRNTLARGDNHNCDFQVVAHSGNTHELDGRHAQFELLRL